MPPKHDLRPRRVPLETLIPHPENPRIGNVGAVRASLRNFGQFRPIVVQKSTDRILAGHHVVKAAAAEGWTEIFAVFLDVDDDVARKILLADNRTSDLGRYDEPSLAALLASIPDLDGTGYSSKDVELLLERIDGRSAHAVEEIDPDDLGKTSKCPRCGYEWRGKGGKA